jgi:hypothetical protein
VLSEGQEDSNIQKRIYVDKIRKLTDQLDQDDHAGSQVSA